MSAIETSKVQVKGVGQWLKRLITSPVLQPWQFVLLYVIFTALVFHWPTYSYAAKHLNLTSLEGWLTLTSLWVFMGLLMLLLLGLPLLISLRMLKWVTALLLFGNALAAYFMHTYRVVLDTEMMGNVLNTQMEEASALFHPAILLWVGLLAVIPSWWIWRLRWAPQRYLVRVMHWLIGLALAALWLYLQAPSLFWLDRHMSRVGALTVPLSYLVNGARIKYREHLANQPIALLPELTPAMTELGKPHRRVVVLVIGESARAANFSLYGYPRLTNPELARIPIEVLRARACASYTTASLACMLSARGASVSQHPPEETLPAYLQRHGVDVEWRSNNFGEPRMALNHRLPKSELVRRCQLPSDRLSVLDRGICKQNPSGAFDGALLLGLEERIESSDRDQVLIVLHQAGSHGPVYYEKYPQGSDTFTPVCKTVDLSACPPGSLINAYDNSIVYTDTLLAEIIARLQRLRGWDSTLVYVSDHGESLGEGGLYFHGTPAAWAPDVQMDIPFLLWRSRATQTNSVVAQDSHSSSSQSKPRLRSGEYSHDHVFHTVVGALGFKGGAYREDRDAMAQKNR